MSYKNLESYEKTDDISFVYSKAEEYIPDEANCFYFFNPFSSKIFRQVLIRIGQSVERNPRDVLISFIFNY